MSNETRESPEILTQPGQITPPDLQTLINFRILNALAATNCHTIGTIIAFYPETQTADISVNFFRTIINSPGENIVLQYPNLISCPVVILSGGEAALTFPIVKGDTCVVMFNDRDIDAWYDSGQVLTPNSERIHDLSDGIALIGIRSKDHPIEDYMTDGTQLRQGTSNITLKDNEDEESASLNQGENTVAVEEKIKIAVGAATLRQALDALFDALIAATITGGAFSAGTITAITNAKIATDAILK